MSRDGLLITLGVLTALAPFSGVPFSWLTWFFVLVGILVALVGLLSRARRVNAARASSEREISPLPSTTLNEPRLPPTP